MLIDINVLIEDLMLDPNNPRFVKDFSFGELITDENVEARQLDILRQFKKTSTTDDEDVTNISDLYQSMMTIGFVAIDRIVVRKLKTSDKFLVIEGSRRVSTIKHILDDYLNNREDFRDPTKKQQLEPLIKNLESPIRCILLETDGVSDEETQHRISVILGLRHHGSLLEWEPLPSAYNIYREYMNTEPRTDTFRFIASRVHDVAYRLSIKKTEVKSALKTYIAYTQLGKVYPIKEKHYSLIEAGVTNTKLSHEFVKTNNDTFQLDETSLENFNIACQFDKRDKITDKPNSDMPKKILRDPKSFNVLGKLYEKKQRSNHEAFKAYASDLISRVLNENDIHMTLETAVDDLVDYENRTKWVDAIEKLLNDQIEKLDINEYTGVGNDKGAKDELKKTISPLVRMMGI